MGYEELVRFRGDLLGIAFNVDEDEIGVIPYLVVLSNCANTGDPTFCGQIVRAPSTGSLTGNSIASGGCWRRSCLPASRA